MCEFSHAGHTKCTPCRCLGATTFWKETRRGWRILVGSAVHNHGIMRISGCLSFVNLELSIGLAEYAARSMCEPVLLARLGT